MFIFRVVSVLSTEHGIFYSIYSGAASRHVSTEPRGVNGQDVNLSRLFAGRGGQPGNQNAKKKDEQSVMIHVRALPDEKKRWQALAKAEGKTLSEWIRTRLNRA